MTDPMNSGAVVRRVPYPVRDSHKQCAKCGKLVSRTAYACRRCGKRQRIRPRTILLALSACLLGGMFAVASAGVVLGSRNADAAVAPVTASPMAQDGVLATPATPAVEVDAVALWLAYNQAPAKADLRFKDRPLRVTGTVRSVERDYEGRIVVRLNTGDAYDTVNARMSFRNDAAATTLGKGRPATLTCIGRGALIGAPLLSDCSVR